MDSITQTAKFRLSVLKFANTHAVTKVAIEFGVSRQTTYRWRKRYDGTFESLKDKSRRPHHHPNQYSQEEIDLIKQMRVKYLHDGLNMFWHRLRCMNYTRSMSALFRVMRRLFYQYTAIDECTRMRYLGAFEEHSTFSSMIFVQQLVKAFPFKICKVQTDNGFESMRPLAFTSPRQALSKFFVTSL